MEGMRWQALLRTFRWKAYCGVTEGPRRFGGPFVFARDLTINMYDAEPASAMKMQGQTLSGSVLGLRGWPDT